MDEDFDTASFDEAYDYSDFGEGQAFGTGDMAGGSSSTQGNFVDMGLGDGTGGDSLSSIMNPALGGGNRTNITNVGEGSNLVYDPAFAAAIDISQGRDPTKNLGGTGGLTVPSYLRPQIEGEFYDPFGDKPMFYSQGEKFLQETLPEIVRSGPIARLARGIGSIFQDGLNFAKDATGGIKLPSLSTMFPDMGGDSDPTVDRVVKPKEEEKEPPFFREDVEGVPQFGTRTMDELQLIPDNMVVSPNFTYGITSVAPKKFFEADRNVSDALQLIPSEFQNTPTDLGSGLRIAPGSGADRFKFTTSTGANLPGLNQLGNVFDILDARNLEKEIGNLTGEERDFLAGRRNRIVGTPSRFVTTTPNFSVPGFRSRSMSEKEAEETKRRLGVL